MNCDCVFDILTRGPFPSGDHNDDQAVESHLSVCHECRQLAEALRPAVDLFHESVAAEEGRDLPGYHGVLCSQPARKISRSIQSAITKPKPAGKHYYASWISNRLAQFGVHRYLAAVVLGIATGTLFWSLAGDGYNGSFNSKLPHLPAHSQLASALYQPGMQGQQDLAAMSLPQDCLRLNQRDTFLCCTQCHSVANVNRPKLSANSITKVDLSCRACHTSN